MFIGFFVIEQPRYEIALKLSESGEYICSGVKHVHHHEVYQEPNPCQDIGRHFVLF